MKLLCYLNNRPPLNIRPAPIQRPWMEKTVDRFAYRCLPLNIANAHGWEICCDESFEATWDGEIYQESIFIKNTTETPVAISHFGSGVLTFHVSCVFRTEPGWNLMVMGPPNHPKRGIHALTGIIETDWAPYSFTMNWVFTEPNHTIQFSKGEPFCFFFPIERHTIEQIEPEFRQMQSDPHLHQQHTMWMERRSQFIEDLKIPHSSATQQKWQRNYFQGQDLQGQTAAEHQTKVRIKTFKL